MKSLAVELDNLDEDLRSAGNDSDATLKGLLEICKEAGFSEIVRQLESALIEVDKGWEARDALDEILLERARTEAYSSRLGLSGLAEWYKQDSFTAGIEWIKARGY